LPLVLYTSETLFLTGKKKITKKKGKRKERKKNEKKEMNFKTLQKKGQQSMSTYTV
jgi:hypothetical protein